MKSIRFCRNAMLWRLATLCLCALAPALHAAPADTARAAAWFDAHRQRPPMLRQFLQRMPKGADLHSHLSGAVYAEQYLAWAAEDELCVNPETLAFGPACGEGDAKNIPTQVFLQGKQMATYNALIDKMSTRNVALSSRSGHDQFFDAFGAFPNVANSPARSAGMAAELADRAGRQATQHLELMFTFQGDAVRKLGAGLPWAEEADFARRLQWLQGKGLADLVTAGRADLDRIHSALREQLACNTAAARPGCAVSIRWLQQTTRTAQPEVVFAQLAYAFALSSADGRVVGLNLVAPEDHLVALRDYTLQMQMIGFLHRQLPQVKIALHAGEMTLGMVAPQHLRSHIREAVTVAGASRVGHAVGIGFEDNAAATLATMRASGVAAEVCLTSNDVILGVRGADHPLLDYLAAGVPVVLASDDEGISRIDLSNEYLRAATTYGLRYRHMKSFSRNSLQYSFLPGTSLWRDSGHTRVAAACQRDAVGSANPSAACKAWLETSERATQQWALERAFNDFERLPDWRSALRH